NPLKAEFYLPAAVDRQQKMGACDVTVYPTSSVWQGVTYPEDKERVKQAIKALIENGEYPKVLWN
ncbi:MAG: nucleotidyltransferase, partial [Clostridia bacterium]|nr:nucleotidyltransferase [Clostridia bacterium]